MLKRAAKWMAVGGLLGGVLLASGCRLFERAPKRAVPQAVAVLEAKSESGVTGRAVFTKMAEGEWIHFRVDISGATPGLHAVHIHEFGDCTSPDGKSAGGHWNPTRSAHGKWGQYGGDFHLGDIGNIEVGPDGTGSFELTTDLWRIGGTENLDVVGKSIVVHAGPDDFTSQPSGAAGARIACGGIISPK